MQIGKVLLIQKSPADVSQYKTRFAHKLRLQRRHTLSQERLRAAPCTTKDGTRISLMADCASVELSLIHILFRFGRDICLYLGPVLLRQFFHSFPLLLYIVFRARGSPSPAACRPFLLRNKRPFLTAIRALPAHGLKISSAQAQSVWMRVKTSSCAAVFY